jgi:predicted PurR-regulated permease PerM
MSSFTFTIFWAIFLTIIFYPVYKKLLRKTKNKRNISAMITIILIFLLIILPISFASYLVIDEIPQINKVFIETNGDKSLIESIPFRDKIQKTLSKYSVSLEVIEKDTLTSIQGSLNTFSKNILSFGKNTIGLILNFFIMLYIMFFGLRDGKHYLVKLSEILPLGDKTEHKLFNKFTSIIRSIFKGTLIIALIQGILAGILLYSTGIHNGILI